MTDRDHVYLSKFWRCLFSLHGTAFLLSWAYRLPPSDGKSEVVNRCSEIHLRCMCGDQPKDWSSWLPLAEWWYNTHFHFFTGVTPYEVVYNQPTPLHLPYLAWEEIKMDRSMQRRENMIQALKFHLKRAQVTMKHQVDAHISTKEFEVSECV